MKRSSRCSLSSRAIVKKQNASRPRHSPNDDGGSQDSEEQAGIDRVTDDRVGTTANKLVVLFDGDGAAPIAPQMRARPDGEGKPGDHHQQSEQIDDHRVGKKTCAEPRQPRSANGQQHGCGDCQHDGEKSARRRFSSSRRLHVARSSQPIGQPSQPQDGKRQVIERVTQPNLRQSMIGEKSAPRPYLACKIWDGSRRSESRLDRDELCSIGIPL